MMALILKSGDHQRDPEGNINVLAKFSSRPSHSCHDPSLIKNTNVNLVVVLDLSLSTGMILTLKINVAKF